MEKQILPDGTFFLNRVREKIEKKIRETEQEIEKGQKDIAGMHEYYWENYTEMDQYGYEDYDNQQALLKSVNANQEKMKTLHRYKKMLDTPFFGRVDFRYDGEEEGDPFYIGIGNFAEKTGALPLVYDWRAPVSSLYYDFDQGEAYYDAPGGRMYGKITSKWQYKIRNGKMIYAFESDMKIDDEILKEELGNNGDVKLKNIVRTIQKEQNEIIRNTKDKIMVIQGAAGSGKTSVALHRIAYLLYHDRKNLKSSNVLILSPNSVFADYISHILPELGEEAIQEMNMDLYAYKELKAFVFDCEDRYDEIERQVFLHDERRMQRFNEKQSSGFIGISEGFLAELEDRLVNLCPVSFRGIEKTEQEMIRLFYFKFQNIPLLVRADAIMESLIDEYETLYNRTVTEEETEELRKKFSGMYVTKDLYVIYNWLMEESGYPKLPCAAYEKRILQYEDVYPMLYLKYRLFGVPAQKKIRHLVIDEMQDYSYLQFEILRMLFTCPMTILGDRAQTIGEKQRDVLQFLPSVFGKNIRKIEMKKSYRNTKEIAEYAAEMRRDKEIKIFERHGKEVDEKEFEDENELLHEITEKINIGNDAYETAAIITVTQAEAQKIYDCLKEKSEEIYYIDRDSTAFRRGITVTTFYLAKGLEFDQVFGVRQSSDKDFFVQSDYITATRAMHELHMYRLKK